MTPATLRAWERRYGAVAPQRSEGGHRLYSDADVERLRVLHSLTESGHPIRLVAQLGTEDARALLMQEVRAPTPGGGYGIASEAVVEAMTLTRALDGEGLRIALRRVGLVLGAVTFLDQVIAPFLTEVGDTWSRGELGPAEEHLASAAVEGVLSWLVEPTTEPSEGPALVVATLPGELHRLGARLVAATAALEGWRVSYLGAELPGREIARAAGALGAGAVAISAIGQPPAPEASTELFALRSELPTGTPLYIGGAGASALLTERAFPGVERLDGLPALRKELERLHRTRGAKR